ncbi:MAG: CBU_0592 family membrane protein [Janthinobacterium lividum]
MTVPDAVGLVGVALYVGAYAGLQTGRLGLADTRYTVLNAVGGLAVIFSLIWSFNLAAFVTQVLWLVFTLVGYLRSRNA